MSLLDGSFVIEYDDITRRTNASVDHLENGNGSWQENRRLIAYVIRDQKNCIDILFDANRKLEARLRNIELRVYGFMSAAGVIIWLLERL